MFNNKEKEQIRKDAEKLLDAMELTLNELINKVKKSNKKYKNYTETGLIFFALEHLLEEEEGKKK